MGILAYFMHTSTNTLIRCVLLLMLPKVPLRRRYRTSAMSAAVSCDCRAMIILDDSIDCIVHLNFMILNASFLKDAKFG
jgi:hypothetical protein